MHDTSDVRQNWASYLNRLMRDRSQAEFARALGVTDGQLSKWRTGTSGHKVETVIEIARKLGDSPLHALVEVGYLEARDVAQFKVAKPFGLDDYSDYELSAEMVRRIQAGEATKDLSRLKLQEDQAGRVTPIRQVLPPEPIELDEVAARTIQHHPDDTDDKYDA